jgi:hypothetical protein
VGSGLIRHVTRRVWHGTRKAAVMRDSPYRRAWSPPQPKGQAEEDVEVFALVLVTLLALIILVVARTAPTISP